MILIFFLNESICKTNYEIVWLIFGTLDLN